MTKARSVMFQHGITIGVKVYKLVLLRDLYRQHYLLYACICDWGIVFVLSLLQYHIT